MEGQKSPVSVPKKIIKSEYLEHADKVAKSRDGTLSPASSSGSSSSVEIVNKPDLTTDFGSVTPNEQLQAFKITLKELPHNNMQSTVLQPIKSTPFDAAEQVNVTDNAETGELLSHCSAAGSCFSEEMSNMQRNHRLFVFPEDCPGYEVVENPCMFSSKYFFKFINQFGMIQFFRNLIKI